MNRSSRRGVNATSNAKREAPVFRLWFYDSKGRGHRIRSLRKLVLLVDHKIIDEKTPILDQNSKMWTSAANIKAYQIYTGIHKPQSERLAASPCSGRSNPVPQRSWPRLSLINSIFLFVSAMFVIISTSVLMPVSNRTSGTASETGLASLGKQVVMLTRDPEPPVSPMGSAIKPDGRLNEIMRNTVAGIERIRSRYNPVITEEYIASALEPEKLSDPLLIEKEQATLKRVSPMIVEFEKDYRSHLDGVEAEIEDVRATGVYDSHRLLALDNLLAEINGLYEGLFRLHRDSVEHIGELYQLMMTSYHIYNTEEGNIVFDDPSGMDYYERLQDKLNMLHAEVRQTSTRIQRTVSRFIRSPLGPSTT